MKKRATAKRAPRKQRDPLPHGRPQSIEPDPKTIDVIRGLGQIQATWKEVAAVLNVTEMTLANAFKRYPILKDEFDRAKQVGFISLRRKQLKLADKNATMAIFLGKNLLGQKDHYEVDTRVLTYDLTKLSDAEFKKLEAGIGPLAIDFDSGHSGGESET